MFGPKNNWFKKIIGLNKMLVQKILVKKSFSQK